MNIIVLAALLMLRPVYGQSAKFLNAVRMVESSGNDSAVGDGGAAIGPFQIHRAYWRDAVEYDRTLLSGEYTDCFRRDYAEKVVRAYLKRYAPKDASDEVLARIHNGGPRGHLKTATRKYWVRVKAEIKAQK